MKWKAFNSLAILLALSAFMLTGCGTAPSNSPAPQRGLRPDSEHDVRNRLRPWRPRRPTLALNSEQLHKQTVGTPLADSRSLWYASRNDRQVSVTSGYETAQHETVVTQTYDRHGFVNGKARDIYSNRTYRTTIRQTVR